MASAHESENFEPDDRVELRAVEDGEELFDPGALGSLTAEQIAIMGMLVRNYDDKEIAWFRGTQPEQIDVTLNNIRRQTGMALSELAPELIELGLIDAPQPETPAPEPESDGVVVTVEQVYEEEPLKDAVETTESEEELIDKPPVARQHIIDYVRWMYPNEKIEGLDELGDEELAAAAAAVRLAAARYAKSLDPTKKQSQRRRAVKPSLTYIDLWLKGNRIPKIAQLTGKNEGSLLLSMSPFAEKIGKTIPLDELLGRSDPSN